MLGLFRRVQPESRATDALDAERYLLLVLRLRDCLRRNGVAPEMVDERHAVWGWWLTRQRLEASEWAR